MTTGRIPGVVEIMTIRSRAGTSRTELCELIDESPLFVEVAGVGRYALMWTPTGHGAVPAGFVPFDGWLGDGAPSDAISLAAGFAFSEGLFERLSDLESIARCPDAPDVVRITLAPPARARANAHAGRRARTVYSSCSACGDDEIGHLLHGVSPVVASTTLSLFTLHRLVETMQERQTLWHTTGAAHAALLFSPDVRVLTIAEDLGRHNALDKAIGGCLLDGLPLEGCGVLLSSRLSFEMVAKAARAGLAIVAGVSAPSSLAVATAHACGITLCGFVREDRATVYTHPRRIAFDAIDRLAVPGSAA